jgi:hypothetical protein
VLSSSPGIDSQPGGIDSLEFGLWYVEGPARGEVRRAEEDFYRTGRSCYRFNRNSYRKARGLEAEQVRFVEDATGKAEIAIEEEETCRMRA